MKPQSKDHTSAIIIGVFATLMFCIVFGAAIEVLKFVALVKWVFG